MYDFDQSITFDGVDIDYIQKGLDLTSNISQNMQVKVESLQESLERMKRPAPMMDDCRDLQDFLQATCYDENYRYAFRYGDHDINGYHICGEDMMEIDNRLIQLHNGTERLLFKINSIEKFIKSKI